MVVIVLLRSSGMVSILHVPESHYIGKLSLGAGASLSLHTFVFALHYNIYIACVFVRVYFNFVSCA